MQNEKDQVQCAVCGAVRKQITAVHVKQHGFKNTDEYKEKYPDSPLFSQSALNNRSQSRGLKVDNPIKNSSSKNDFHISKNRTKKRITYDEFLVLLNQGQTLRQMKDSGISKHQVGFFSALAQNKISITKEQFQKEYLSGKSLDEISQIYKIQRDHVTQLRDYFGIKRLGPKFINRKKTEKPLTFRQKKIVYGGLLGDASKASPSSIKMKQSRKQEKYLMWKHDELKEHVSAKSLQTGSQWDKRYDKTYHYIRFYTHANTDIETIISQFYKNNTKVVTQEILDNLDALSLAVWFMDDGKTGWSYLTREKRGWNIKPESILCTECFSKEENEMICNWFHKKWDINCRLRKTMKPGHFRVAFSTDTVSKLHALIKPYFISSMLYKIDYVAYKQYRDDKYEMSKIEIDEFEFGEDI